MHLRGKKSPPASIPGRGLRLGNSNYGGNGDKTRKASMKHATRRWEPGGDLKETAKEISRYISDSGSAEE